MKTITIKIIKKSVMGVVEGISATIAQHNPEVEFQTIWASDSEEGKLDIHYREAVTDLESFLARFTSTTSGQFDLQRLADDYVITIQTLTNWPPRLSGVLTNLIQNYLVHAIAAGWLSDFPDIKATDYAGMGASDLDAIKEILLKKNFCFAEKARHQDRDVKVGNGVAVADRSSDEEVKVGNGVAVGDRSSDAEVKVGNGVAVGDRSSDSDGKETDILRAEARNDDRVDKNAGRGVKATERNKDFMSQHFHHDYVDWSGGRPPLELR